MTGSVSPGGERYTALAAALMVLLVGLVVLGAGVGLAWADQRELCSVTADSEMPQCRSRSPIIVAGAVIAGVGAMLTVRAVRRMRISGARQVVVVAALLVAFVGIAIVWGRSEPRARGGQEGAGLSAMEAGRILRCEDQIGVTTFDADPGSAAASAEEVLSMYVRSQVSHLEPGIFQPLLSSAGSEQVYEGRSDELRYLVHVSRRPEGWVLSAASTCRRAPPT